MTSQFDIDLHLADTDRPLVYRGSFAERWYMDRSLNGGHVIAAMVRAFERAVADPVRAMRSVTVHFVQPAKPGAYDVEVVIDRAGRSLTNARAQIVQGGAVVASAMAALGADWESLDWDTTRMPDVEPPEACPELWEGGPTVALHHNYLYRRAIGGRIRHDATPVVSGGWLRLADPRPVDAALAAGLADTWPPAVFASTSTPIMFPTIDLTVQLRGPLPLPDDDPTQHCLVVHRADTATHGYVIQDTEVWTRSGHLIARGRQHALLIPLRAG